MMENLYFCYPSERIHVNIFESKIFTLAGNMVISGSLVGDINRQNDLRLIRCMCSGYSVVEHQLVKLKIWIQIPSQMQIFYKNINLYLIPLHTIKFKVIYIHNPVKYWTYFYTILKNCVLIILSTGNNICCVTSVTIVFW